MERIREESLPKWLEMQDKRWRCQACGAPHSWYHETCPQCGQAVASYRADL
jgi:rubrerythrin